MGLRAWLGRLKWDLQYLSGYWSHIDSPPEPDLIEIIHRHLRGGTILDLGCGTGTTVAVLKDHSFYQGVDISEVAIRTARKRYANEKNSFVVANILDFQPAMEFDVILLSEVIYYVKLGEVRELLWRYKKSLKNGGVFVARIWNVESKGDFVRAISDSFHVVETKGITGMPLSVIMTFS